MNFGKHFAAGVRAGVPILIGFLPIATTFSLLAAQSGLTGLETDMMSLFVLAGASQMAAVRMLAAGSGAAAILLAVFFMNLRHLIMSTCVMQKLEKTPRAVRLLAAFGVTDESFAVFTSPQNEDHTAAFLLGLAGMTWLSWAGGTVLGSFLIRLLPAGVSAWLVIALYAMFIQIVAPDAVRHGDVAVTVLVSIALNCLLGLWLPSGWAMIAAMLCGAAAGTACHRIPKRKAAEKA